MTFEPGRMILHRNTRHGRLGWVRPGRVIGDDDRGLLLLNEFVPVNVQGPESFVKSHRQFLVWGERDKFGWFLRYLADHG